MMVEQDGNWNNTEVLFLILPDRFVSHYTPAFLRQFIVCSIAVFAKVDAMDQWAGSRMVSCVAEELAIPGLIESMPQVGPFSVSEQMMIHYEEFREHIVEDFDVDMLFDPALDGIVRGMPYQSAP